MGFVETSQDITATIKEQTDIVKVIGEYVDLKRSGVRYLGLCPFHGEKTPSFSVHGSEQFFYCFGCAESGDVFSFLMKYHNYDFPTAMKYLADRLNIELPKKQVSGKEKRQQEERARMHEVTAKAAQIYRRFLLGDQAAEEARRYLGERGISEEIQERFSIGYAPSKEYAGWDFLRRRLSMEEAKTAEKVGLLARGERGGTYDRFRDRILFPIHNIKGNICGFGGRIVGEGQPKYMNSPESPIFNKSANLLGLYQQAAEIRRQRKIVLVEGNFDMISLVQHGCGNVAAPLGTALTSAQIRLLSKYAEEAILLFDGDAAGIKAAMRAAPLFLAEQIHARVALLPDGHDPDTYVREQGVAALEDLLSSAEELPEFVLEQLVAEHGLSLEGKSKIAEQLGPLLSAASSSLQRSVIVAHFSDRLGVPAERLERSLQGEVKATPTDRVGKPAKEPAIKVDRPLNSAQKRLVEFMVLHLPYFHRLEEAGIRDALAGGVGEIVFLQIRKMVTENNEVEPEEILQVLPEGPEREVVADTLLQAPEAAESEEAEEELSELVDWLKLQTMRNRSRELNDKISDAQKNGDFSVLVQLLQDKQEVDRKIDSLER